MIEGGIFIVTHNTCYVIIYYKLDILSQILYYDLYKPTYIYTFLV